MEAMDTALPSLLADFDRPLEMMTGCHERLRHQCALIERIADHLQWRGPDEEAHDVAAYVAGYFDTSIEQHHRDEEEDLFPILEHHVPSRELNATRALLFRLRAEHRRLARLRTQMRARLAAVVERRDGGLTPEVAREFSGAYERHMALEEAELLPLARRVLDAQLMGRLGKAMARRRGAPQAA